MRIIYVTTSIEENDYKEFLKLWKKAPNPSNQNFHNKMIRSLAISHPVDVISIRPFSKKLVSERYFKKDNKDTDNISWHYLTINRHKLTRFVRIKKEALAIAKEIKKNHLDEEIVLFTDTINPTCVSNAVRISKKCSLPCVGVCTDSPSNITGTNRAYTMFLLSTASKCQGYIALTQGLNDLYNQNGKASSVIEGVVESSPVMFKDLNIKKDYFFFGGALLERYGVYNLIEAFKRLDNKDIDLYLCGHHGSKEKIENAISGYPNIHFLGAIPVQDVRLYEEKAIANINPRPYSEDLDRFSIPSKTIEYFASGRPTISVKNTRLQKIFQDEAIWAKSGSVEDLLISMQRLLSLNENERKNLGRLAKEKVLSLYSLEEVNKRLDSFLEIFKRRQD